MIQLASIIPFIIKHWKPLLLALIVSGIVYTIYSQKAVIADLTTDLIVTKQELENVKKNYATLTELNKVRDDIATANLEVINRVNDTNRRVSTGLRDIESKVRQNASEVEQIQLELNKEVSDFVLDEIQRRGYD